MPSSGTLWVVKHLSQVRCLVAVYILSSLLLYEPGCIAVMASPKHVTNAAFQYT